MLNETIFLDYQATTPIDPVVLEAMIPWMGGPWNPHATAHHLGRAASDAVEVARGQVAGLLGCRDSEITFTSGATESSNIVLRGITDEGDSIAVSVLEHASVSETAKVLSKEGRPLHRITVHDDGILDFGSLEAVMAFGPKLVSISAVNNEIGIIQPVEEVALMCADREVLFHSDITQSVGRTPSAIHTAPVDYASLSSHKVYGPQGIGALFIRNGAPKPQPLSSGGGQERGLRPGTLPVASCVGFGAACELAATRREQDAEHARNLSSILLSELSDLSGWQVNGSMEDRIPHNLSIAFEGVDADVLLAALPELALSTGSACSSGTAGVSEVLRAIGLSEELAGGTVRIGFGRTTTAGEVRTATDLIRERVRMFRGNLL